MGKRCLLCLDGFFLLLYIDLGSKICASEEVCEKYEVRGVHNEGDFNVVVRHVTLVASLLHLVCPDVDCGAHDHLRELRCGDNHRDEPRHTELQCLEGIVAVHDAVYDVVHAHEPTCSGNVVRVGVPCVQ